MNEQRSEIEPREQELAYHSRVVLHFFRHGKKEKVEGMADEKIHLTEAGRLQAHEKGQEIQPQADVSVAIGSPRERAQETAARVMLHDQVTVDQDFNSIVEQTNIVRDGKIIAKRIVENPRLNFSETKGTIVGDAGNKAYLENQYLDYLINKSDSLVLEQNDQQNTCLTRLAGNIAEIIYKYYQVSDNFDRLVANKPDEYRKFNNQMERYLGTHQGVGEAFLAKILFEKIGEEAVDRWLEETNGAGFRETQGFDIEINTSKDGNKQILLNYDIGNGNKTIEITKELLKKIVNDRDDFEKKMVNN